MRTIGELLAWTQMLALPVIAATRNEPAKPQLTTTQNPPAA